MFVYIFCFSPVVLWPLNPFGSSWSCVVVTVDYYRAKRESIEAGADAGLRNDGAPAATRA